MLETKREPGVVVVVVVWYGARKSCIDHSIIVGFSLFCY
jgi:hypothetical protein